MSCNPSIKEGYKMNKRKLDSLIIMKMRLKKYAFDEGNENVQYELFELIHQLDKIFQVVKQ